MAGSGARETYCGDEPVQRLPSLCVLDCDGAEVIAEPDGGDNAASVAVGNILLRERGGRRDVTCRTSIRWGRAWTAEGTQAASSQLLWRPWTGSTARARWVPSAMGNRPHSLQVEPERSTNLRVTRRRKVGFVLGLSISSLNSQPHEVYSFMLLATSAVLRFQG